MPAYGPQTQRRFGPRTEGSFVSALETERQASSWLRRLAILFYSQTPSVRSRPLLPFPGPDGRSKLSLLIGETHFHAATGRAPNPTWLTIQRRG